jgi:hypothetical protein
VEFLKSFWTPNFSLLAQFYKDDVLQAPEAELEGVIDTLVVETAYGNVRGFSKIVEDTKLLTFNPILQYTADV